MLLLKLLLFLVLLLLLLMVLLDSLTMPLGALLGMVFLCGRRDSIHRVVLAPASAADTSSRISLLLLLLLMTLMLLWIKELCRLVHGVGLG